jgi:ThiF family
VKWELHMRGDHWKRLHDHLYSTPAEHGAVLLCGQSVTPHRTRILVHEVILAEDGTDYRYVDGVYRLDARFVSRTALRARQLGLMYVAVHPHGGYDCVDFSPVDHASQLKSIQPLLAATRAHTVGWLVTAPTAGRCLLRTASGEQAVEKIVILDPKTRTILTPSPPASLSHTSVRWHRQTLIYGDVGQVLLSRATVGIIGLGGGGSILNDLLSSLGVGHLIHVDPDRVDITNLPRLIGATRWDALEPLSRLIPAPLRERLSTSKVRIARRVAHRNSPGITVKTYKTTAESGSALAALLNCDYIFLAADTAGARLLANILATQYLIPVTQIGAKIRANEGGTIEDVYAVSRVVGRAAGCLWCNSLINSQRLAEEGVSGKQREIQRYVADVPNPSVKSLNALAAAWAVEDFRNWYTGLGSAGQNYVTMRPGSGRTLRSAPRHAETCPFCHDKLGNGDVTRVSAATDCSASVAPKRTSFGRLRSRRDSQL